MKRGAVVALVLVSVIAVAEIATRVLDVGPAVPLGTTPDLFVSHPTREFELNPGFEGQSTESGETLDIDARGLRRRARQAAPGARQVLVIGDGQTFGLGVESHEAWPLVTEELLLAAQHDVAFVNAGVPGYDARRAVDRMSELVPTLDPTLVLWAIYVGNDVAAAWNEKPRRVVAGLLVEDGSPFLLPRTYLHRYSRAWRGLVEPRLAGEEDTEDERRSTLRVALDWDPAFSFGLAAKVVPQGVEESWSAFESALERARTLCADHGVPLEIVVLPAQVEVDPRLWVEIHDRLRIDPAEYELDRPRERLRGLLAEAKLRIHDPAARLAAWCEAATDAETAPYAGFFLSAWGQRLVGQSIAESLVESGSL